jgi:hypothetical protein
MFCTFFCAVTIIFSSTRLFLFSAVIAFVSSTEKAGNGVLVVARTRNIGFSKNNFIKQSSALNKQILVVVLTALA